MYSKDYDREKSLYLVLSVLLHIILIFALMHLHWDNSTQQDLLENQDEIPEIVPYQPKVAALKPRASQFGAPVIFKEEPTFTPKNTDNESSSVTSEIGAEEDVVEQEKVPPTPQQQGLEENPAHVLRQAQDERLKTQQYQADEPKLDTDKKLEPQQQTTHITKIPEKTELRAAPKPEKEVKQEAPSQEEKPVVQTAMVQPQPKQQQAQKQQIQRTRHQSGKQTEDAAPITKQLTFADLAHGFIQTIKNEGQDLLERDGDESIRPDLEEMKLISYKQKVVWFIQNAFRIRSNEEPPHPESIVNCHTVLTLDGDGKIIKLYLVNSTGVTQFDKYYIDVIRTAAPYPPLPQHIKKPFVFPFTMVYYTRPSQIAARKQYRPRLGVSFR